MADYKKIGMTALEYGLGGIITVFGGSWIAPYINNILTMNILDKPISIIGLDAIHVIAYGAAFAAAWWVNKKVFGKPQ